jgi:hypothetical protein
LDIASRPHVKRNGYAFAERGERGDGRGGRYCAYWVFELKGQEGASIVKGVWLNKSCDCGVGRVWGGKFWIEDATET